jgi:ribosome maturation factor RimP
MRQTELDELLRPCIENMGLELWSLEYMSQGRRGLLRIFIDEAERGVTLEDCERVSREVSAVLDVEDPFAGAFTLEVSSPGLDRALHNKAQYERFVGSTLKVRLRIGYEGRRNFNGVLMGVEQEDVVLRNGEEEYLFPISSIENATVVPQLEKKDK